MKYFAPLLLILCLAQEPEEVQRNIDALSSESLESRTKAHAKLQKSGSDALPLLRKALAAADADLRARLHQIISEIERVELERKHDARNRPKALRLVTVDLENISLGDAMRKLGKEHSFNYEFEQKLAAKPVSLRVKSMPLLEALDKMVKPLGLYVSHFWLPKIELDSTKSRPSRVYTPGARFTIQGARKWRKGWVLSTRHEEYLHGEIEFDVVQVLGKDDQPIKFERCGKCSPRDVYVPNQESARPIIKGIRRWYSPYELVFTNPKNSQTKRVGDFDITIKWPELEVTSRRGWSEHIIAQTARDFSFTPKKGRAKDLGIMGGGGGGHYGSRLTKRSFINSWCDCRGKPQPLIEKKVALVRHRKITSDFARSYRLDDIEKITLKFYKPVEEPFELKGPVIGPPKR